MTQPGAETCGAQHLRGERQELTTGDCEQSGPLCVNRKEHVAEEHPPRSSAGRRDVLLPPERLRGRRGGSHAGLYLWV